MLVYCLRISYLQKFISVKCKNVAVQQNRETSVPQIILYCTTIFYEILILHFKKNSLLENLITNHGTRKKQNWSLIFILGLQWAWWYSWDLRCCCKCGGGYVAVKKRAFYAARKKKWTEMPQNCGGQMVIKIGTIVSSSIV